MLWVAPPNILPITALEQNFFSFNFDIDAPKIFETSGIYTQSAVEYAEPNSTDLQPFERHGGKLIIYEGLADGAFSANDIIHWYERTGEESRGFADRFSRLYMVPGMGHCGGGPATSQFDVFTPLVDWVEYGIVPTALLEPHQPPVLRGRTERGLCALSHSKLAMSGAEALRMRLISDA
jgi:Tannase and feruloyl esterase